VKVYVEAPENLSRAMFRVAAALERHAPDGIRVVQHAAQADLLVHHVIGIEAVKYKVDRPCAVLQYCVNSATPEGSRPWWPLWERARAVWSYYDLAPHMPPGARFYYAPLGVDPVFRVQVLPNVPREIGLMTSGYANGQGQEAIEEPILAARQVGLKTVHLGPIPTGLSRIKEIEVTGTGVPDMKVTRLYHRVQWVSGLRYVEGFELGCIEGLVCGARPVVFDRPEMRAWFGDHAEFVPECTGDELVAHLALLFAKPPRPVTEEERRAVLAKFNWRPLVTRFWDLVKERS
jgi:hypothetical protein